MMTESGLWWRLALAGAGGCYIYVNSVAVRMLRFSMPDLDFRFVEMSTSEESSQMKTLTS